ncbi:hypothetical protein KCG44_02230 [Pacificimonas sp. WHA3]|uniref:Cytochrome c domain-containing protein n=1 Tax=Pacificimonas pallii TaxID=2827236 RepID=A0ABS6SB10_9SPHN|nr:di-heme-cytochrome C peroxidase [Pacificimonas pallii]MBV7255598.1 hypothetical protein [Pacificimonas pallii]
MRTLDTGLIFGASTIVVALLSACQTGDKGQITACKPTDTVLTGNVAANGLDDAGLLDWAQQSQGSRLMPASWFGALERPDGSGDIADTDFLAGLGFATDDALTYPVGLALDCQDESELPHTKLAWYSGQVHQDPERVEGWVGLNCAACHSGTVTAGNVTKLVPGAPSRLDYQSFVEAVDAALQQTHPDVNPDRFDRFARRVFAASAQDDNDENRALLTAALADLIAWQRKTELRNFPEGEDRPRYGLSRVDAFGHIYNKITLFAGAQDVRNPSNAPVSYPFLWGIQDQKTVQWNGSVANARLNNPLKIGNRELIDYGAFGRNSGEVLGVFGDLKITERPGERPSYKSSVRANNLMRLEELVGKLRPPKLSEFMPLKPDAMTDADYASLVSAGQDLFGRHCSGCHLGAGETNDDGGTEVNVNFAAMQAGGNLTDIGMACNAMLYESETVRMQGVKTELIGGGELPDVAPVGQMLEVSVKGVVADNVGTLVREVLANLWGVEPAFDEPVLTEMTPEDLCMSLIDTEQGRKALQYKARPLDGIWATGPYLHNGSVRTLEQLLMRPEFRETEFWVGSTEFDADGIGFTSQASTDGSTFRFDTSLPGNSNQGHVYGAEIFSGGGDDTEQADARRAILAYMKTL